MHALKHKVMDTNKILAEKLLQSNAVKLQPAMPFVWGSGWNSPIYNDHRRLLSYPDVRNFIKILIAKTVIDNFPGVQALVSVVTGAIPMGAIVADTLGLPFAFVRDTPKDHGLENLIEGNLKPRQKVVLIEDIITTGGSVSRAAEIVSDAGCEVLGVISLFTYGFPMSIKRFRNENLNVVSLTDFSTLIDVAVEKEYLHPDDVETLIDWRRDPAVWVPNNRNL